MNWRAALDSYQSRCVARTGIFVWQGRDVDNIANIRWYAAWG